MLNGKRHGVGRLTSPGLQCPGTPDIVYEGSIKFIGRFLILVFQALLINRIVEE
jgi:hypothetical protein